MNVLVEACIVDQFLNVVSVGHVVIEIEMLKNWTVGLVAWEIEWSYFHKSFLLIVLQNLGNSLI